MEHPIIYNTEMVRAYLDDRKTMTRRVMKPQPIVAFYYGSIPQFRCTGFGKKPYSPGYAPEELVKFCPYGQVGSTLWVRETWTDLWMSSIDLGNVIYKATPPNARFTVSRWKPTIHMFRWASRLTQTITGLRVERLQNITEVDAMDEGIDEIGYLQFPDGHKGLCFRANFVELWDSINAKPKPHYVKGKIAFYESYPWEDIRETRTHRGLPWYVYGNPWVWVISYPKYSEEPTRSK